MKKRLVAGCMSGTSMDAIDAALVEIAGRGLTMRARLLDFASAPLGKLAARLRAAGNQEPLSAGGFARLSAEFSAAHVGVLRRLVGRRRIDLIAVHGQTVFHAPPVSWQMLTPAPIARALKTPVVFDLRAADLAAGGQGAPITPIADYVFFRAARETRVVVNLGGFCNYTWLPAARTSRGRSAAALVRHVRGGDICVCNLLLDEIARQALGRPYDRDGRAAMRGRINHEACDHLAKLLAKQARGGRSLGTGDEMMSWHERHAARCSGPDLARAACDAIAETVSNAIGPADGVLLAGGGSKNRALVEALRARRRGEVSLTDFFGVPAQEREAAAMAVLGALCQDGVAITLPRITRLPRGTAAPTAGARCGWSQ